MSPEKRSNTIPRPRTCVYGVNHSFQNDHEYEQAKILLEDIHSKAKAWKNVEKKKIGLELTMTELLFIQDQKLSDMCHWLKQNGMAWRTDYFRFWHGMVHGLKNQYILLPIDHDVHKAAQDAALGRNDMETANRHFLQRSAHMGRQIMSEPMVAAVVGRAHLQGLNGWPSGLQAKLRTRIGAQIKIFRPMEIKGRRTFAVNNAPNLLRKIRRRTG